LYDLRYIEFVGEIGAYDLEQSFPSNTTVDIAGHLKRPIADFDVDLRYIMLYFS